MSNYMDKIRAKIERENRTIFNANLRYPGTPARLAHYRKEAESWKTKHPETFTSYHDWKEHAKHGTRRLWDKGRLGTKKGDMHDLRIFSDNLDDIGEHVGNAQDFARLDYSGWYVDHFCSDTMRGEVCKLRTSKGTLYIPATSCTGWDGVTHYIGAAELVAKGADEDAHREAMKEAALYSDECARVEAEEAKEYAVKDLAERDIEESQAEIHDINKKALPLIREIKATGKQYTPAICAALREKLADYMAERAELFKRIEARRENPYSAVEGF